MTCHPGAGTSPEHSQTDTHTKRKRESSRSSSQSSPSFLSTQPQPRPTPLTSRQPTQPHPFTLQRDCGLRLQRSTWPSAPVLGSFFLLLSGYPRDSCGSSPDDQRRVPFPRNRLHLGSPSFPAALVRAAAASAFTTINTVHRHRGPPSVCTGDSGASPSPPLCRLHQKGLPFRQG